MSYRTTKTSRSTASRKRYKSSNGLTKLLKKMGIHLRPRTGFMCLASLFLFGFLAWGATSGQFGIWQTQTKESFHTAAKNNGFAIAYIDVEGRTLTDRAQLSTLITPHGGQSIFATSLDNIREIITANMAWVDDVSVQRILPNRLAITLHEVQPRARYYHGHKRYILNNTPKNETTLVMYEDMYNHFAHLPLITGSGAPEKSDVILGALDARPFLNIHVKAMSFISQRRWNISLENGTEILLPENKIAMNAALDRLSDVIENENLLTKNIVRLDMRLKDRHIVRVGPDAPDNKPTHSKHSQVTLSSKTGY